MKICISGTQCVGKSTLIEDFLKVWPNYKRSDTTYRDKAKQDPRIKLNQTGNKESQELIRNALIDESQQYSRKDNIIFDRCVIDNLAYSFWLHEKGLGDVDDNFIAKQIPIIKEALKSYDIIFFIPLLDAYKVELVPDADGTRDIDPVFRIEINNIMKALYGDFYKKKRSFFPGDDCPAVIECFGSRLERIEMIKLYVSPAGTAYGENDSLLQELDKEQKDNLKNSIIV